MHLRPLAAALVALPLAAGAAGCSSRDKTPALSAKRVSDDIPVPPENGPKLGSLALSTPVLDRPSPDGIRLGFLHAGARVTRADKPIGQDGCPGGWYPVRPRGVVCADQGVSLDASNPALSAMGPPQQAQPMPYAYGRTVRKTPLLELTASGPRQVSELLVRTTIAIAGSSKAQDASGKVVTLAMTTDGKFVNAIDLEPLREPTFHGVELNEGRQLPVGFVVREGVEPVKINDGHVEKSSPLERLSFVALTGKSHNRGTDKYWAVEDGSYIRNRDVATIARKDKLPDFARDDVKWIDVSTVTGSLVLYEGRKPVFATLVSTGLDRNGGARETHLGTFFVSGKQITAVRPEKPLDESHDVRDVPWVIELSSGQQIHASYWHHRFGLPYGTGNLQLSPADAARVFKWVDPPLPEGWYGASAPEGDEAKRTMVVIHR